VTRFSNAEKNFGKKQSRFIFAIHIDKTTLRMKNTASYTSTLPSDLMLQLNEFSERLKIPKNKLIETSLKRYFEELKRREFAEGFKRAAQDPEMQEMAEEGLTDYVKMLDKL